MALTSITYMVAWLVVALACVGVLSAFITRHRNRHQARRQEALKLMAALQRYSGWVLGQRLVALFQGEDQEAAQALEEACTIRMAWFPELAGDMEELIAVHNRLITFLGTQQTLWLRDPEHWLQSQHDKRFMVLWRQHRHAVQSLQGRLEQVASLRRPVAAQRQSTYA